MRCVFSLPPTSIFIVTPSLERLPAKAKDPSLVMRQLLVKPRWTLTQYYRSMGLSLLLLPLLLLLSILLTYIWDPYKYIMVLLPQTKYTNEKKQVKSGKSTK